MALFADGYAALSGLLAPLTVRYGNQLRLAGDDLPRPERKWVPTRHGRVRVHVYRPPGIENPAVHIHLHGGAFMMRYPQMDDFFCRFVVDQSRVAVVNVDYLAAPRVRYPVAQEQAHDVLAWLAEHAGEWGVDATRISIGGFSGGGNLAASACLQARDRKSAAPRLQVLAVPSLDVAGDIHGKPSTIAHPMIGPGLLRLVRATYFRDVIRRSEPYASPLLVDSVVGLPSSVVLTAEYDSLRAEGDAYAARLSEAGVPVEHHVVPRRDHYFLDGGDHTQAAQWMGLMADRISSALAT